MVKWISAQDPQSSIGNAISSAAQALWGDTLTPALKREELRKAQRENAGTEALMSAFGSWGDAAANLPRPSAPSSGPRASVSLASMADPMTSGMLAEPTKPMTFGTDAMFASPSDLKYGYVGKDGLRRGIIDTAETIGASPLDLATVIGYETGGTFDPMQTGPTTQHGTHEGYIQFGDPQAVEYGATFNDSYNSMNSQLGPDGAVAKYFIDNGYEPGMDLLDLYSTVNAGAPGRYGASDAGNGGAPGTVADKVAGMGGHADVASYLLGPEFLPGATASPMTAPPSAEPGTYDPMNPGQMYGELAMRAIESGTNPQDVADLARMFAAGAFGAENQATTDAFVGAGGDYGKTYSGFAADQNRQERDSTRDSGVTMRGQDTDYSLGVYEDENDLVTVMRGGQAIQVHKGDMLPTDRAVLSDSEVKGMVASGMEMTPEQQAAYVGAEPAKPLVADGYYSATTGLVHRSINGMTDELTGEPLPADAVKTSVVSADRTGTGLDKINDRNVENQILSIDSALGDLKVFSRVGADPRLFGVSGAGLRLGANLLQQWDQIVATDPEAAREVTEGNARNIGTLRDLAVQEGFDPDGVLAKFLTTELVPDMSELEMYAAIMPYTLASAMAGQEGRSVTDKDVQTFKRMIGDPTALFSTQQGFQAKIKATESYLRRHREHLTGARTEGVGEGPPVTEPAGPPPVINSNDDAAYDALPSGTEFVDENGDPWVKP